MQKEILDTYPSAKLKVYAIWLPYFPGDARDRWSPDLLSDPRVTHYWDGDFTLGQAQITDDGKVFSGKKLFFDFAAAPPTGKP